MSALEDTLKIFHWLPEKDEWEPISYEAWTGFKGILTPRTGLPGISGGVHHFIACVLDDDGTVVNLIPHKYLIEMNGKLGPANFEGLTKDEREEYWKLMTAREDTPEDRKRLNEIRDKMWPAYQPPKESIEALKWVLPNRPKRGSAAERFLAEFK